METLGRKLRDDGPQTDDELHAWIKVNLGVDIPRVACCPDHAAPFQFIADVYFERVGSALAMANRGGSKTFAVAIIHFLNATFKPGCESLSFGATEGQGKRCYANIDAWCYVRDKETGRKTEVVKDFIDGKPKITETNWKTGSKVEIVAGTATAVSGPHPAKSHADEVELMDDGTWNQSRGMAVTNNPTGPLPQFMQDLGLDTIPPQDIVTSTRNSRSGRMQELLDEIEEDLKEGNIPQFTLYIWCIWETVKQVTSCRNAPKKEREAALRAEGRDPTELCQCHRVVKGRHQDGSPRTLQSVCAIKDPDNNNVVVNGKAFKGRGWKPYVDLVSTFKRNTRGTWTLQHECREGRDENSIIEDWDLTYYGIQNYEPDPSYGPIYQGIDWGGTNPFCALWFQYLTVDIEAFDFFYRPIWLRTNIYVLFNEVYVAGVDTPRFADRVMEVENGYRQKYGHRWTVAGRYMDPQGKSDRIHFRKRGMGGGWPVGTRKKDLIIPTVQNLVEDDMFAVDIEACPAFCQEIEEWQYKPNTKDELDKNNHAMAAWRYAIANAETIERPKRPEDQVNQEDKKDEPMPGGAKVIIRNPKKHQDRQRIGPVGISGVQKAPPELATMR